MPAPGEPEGNPPAERPKPRWTLALVAILAVGFLFVLVPFLFWEATWFGRPLNDDQLAKAFADSEQPREIQHALSQVADRILSPVPAARASARQFYPAVAQVAQTGGSELRLTAAWVMGQDNSVPEFHQELLRLLADPNPMVRRNAALALVRFGDAAGRGEIRAMLRPYPIAAPAAGAVAERIKPAEVLNPGTLVGRIDAPGQRTEVRSEVRSEVPGAVERWLVPNGAPVASGQPILLVDPSSAEIHDALLALAIVGEKEDLPLIAQYSQYGSPEVRQQADATAQAIRARAAG